MRSIARYMLRAAARHNGLPGNTRLARRQRLHQSSRRRNPSVERQTLAGAVTLIADRDKVLGVDTVGFADKAANKPMHAR